jgi:4-hydroxy-3-methylbut-2-en-1-yl diphosphate reductase
MSSGQPAVIYRKGLDLKEAVAGALSADYDSSLVESIKADGYRYTSGRLTVHLAHEFGFCYGVDRAVDYAYQARQRFADRPVYLTGEIIHNPDVNDKLRAAGIRFLSDPGESAERLGPGDVVILPAFGVSVGVLADFQARGCTLVDTTCGSVLNVWKNVTRYARDGFTALIHGKYKHEETRATASQALTFPGGQYLVVLDRPEADLVCDYIRQGGDRDAFLARFAHAVSPGFDPDRDLVRVGLANQTTMLMSESLEIGVVVERAMRDRYGDAELATQERQDAVVELLDHQSIDLMVVIGGYNSSNTCNLARLCAARVPTYHIADAECLASGQTIRHRPVTLAKGNAAEIETAAWLPGGALSIGLTAGASTPNAIVGRVVQRLADLTATAG